MDEVRISVHTLAGRLVGRVEGRGAAGYNTLAWEAPAGLASGTYPYSVRAGDGAKQTGVLVIAR